MLGACELGPESKPEGCRRFPLGLVATPVGGRITTEHRCPCRTMGDRPEIRPEEVEPSIADGGSRLIADRRIKRIPIKPKKNIKFSEWEPIEAEYLRRLNGREPVHRILDAKPFPKLHGSSWEAQATEFIGARDGSQFGVAMAWMGDTIDAMQSGRTPRPPGRPWSQAFDRAQARAPKARTSRSVFGDWIADEVWSLKWADDYDFELARTELVTRLAIAEDICARLARVRSTSRSGGRRSRDDRRSGWRVGLLDRGQGLHAPLMTSAERTTMKLSLSRSDDRCARSSKSYSDDVTSAFPSSPRCRPCSIRGSRFRRATG